MNPRVDRQISPPILNGPAPGVKKIVYPESPRYRRIRALSILMDQSIVLPSGFRIGLDPLLGLLPGVGDAISALISVYVVYESALLGLKKRVLLAMLGNIALDALVGSFPVLGDIFDAVWKANMRNLRLLDKHYSPATPERSATQLAAWMLGVAVLLLLSMGTLFYVTVHLLLGLIGALISFLW